MAARPMFPADTIRQSRLPMTDSDWFSDASPWGALRPRGWGGLWLKVARSFPGGWPWSRLALLARRVARRALRGPVDTRIWGQRLRFFPDRSVSEARILFLPRSWDRAERRLLGEWAAAPGFTFVDVGANVGGYSFWVLSRLGDSGRIVAVEPNPPLARQLRYNVRVNGAGDRVRVVEAAVGAERGAGRLAVGSRNSGENRLVGAGEASVDDGGASAGGGGASVGSRDAAGPGDAARRPETVPVTVLTLADVVAQAGIDRIDCLKVDVEGREAAVIQPYLSAAPRAKWPKYLIVELKRPSGGGALRRATEGPAARAGAVNQPSAQVSATALEEWLAARGYVRVLRTKLNGLFRLA